MGDLQSQRRELGHDVDMGSINPLRKIAELFSRPGEEADPETLQEAFRSHYRNFRALLTANNNALELMAEMEEALTRGQPFGMAFVRGHSTAVSVNVYKMIDNLIDLSGGKYRVLLDSFKAVSEEMEQVLARQPHIPEGKYVLPLSQVAKEDADLAGGKMANLGEVSNKVGLRVPPGFVITATATQHFMSTGGLQDEINRQLKTVDLDDLESLYTTSAQIQKLISAAPVSDELAAQILEGYEELAREAEQRPQVSLRSSAVEEDSGRLSFAGQYRTQLNISEELIIQTYKEIVASKYQSQAIIYRHQRGFRHLDVVMCVGCLAMVDAAISGVMFSRSPRNPHSAWIEINAAPGLPGAVVEGSVSTDFYRVGREEPKIIAHEETRGKEPILDQEQIRDLASIAMRLEQHFGVPQDIEWSIDQQGEIVILQSRPLVEPKEEADVAARETGAESGALLAGGLTASAGVAAGPVFKVLSYVDLLEFPVGAVMVVDNPLPEWASLMNRAVAVVSQTGHAATHLAIVARELGIPALLGVAGAVAGLENGVVVTVDAAGRAVYSGKNKKALKRAAPPPNLMTGSPVHLILQEIMEKVTPLNLTDPGSPYFKASQCQTLHDITRFCHEKAVTEMFSFGEKARFDARSAKQLVGKTPFQWWVIDVDDGFREGFDIHGKYVSVDDIISRPMLAIWEGMNFKPWQGPPPVSLKGFGSILYRSTMNPSIDPSVRASLGGKNYFLISRNFCNLSLRLGYHFALVEAYLGSHLTENYVSFQFKGGAADRSRRFIRVYLLRDILEKFGFRVEVKFDALTARIEKREKEELIDGLKILGYLLIHTRQIDMAMGDQSMVERYRQTIIKDLNRMISTETDTGKGESL